MAPLLTKLSQFRKRILILTSEKKSGRKKLSQDLATIEKETGNVVCIARATVPGYMRRCHPQDQSPLFKLPGELREMIISYALTPDPWQDSFDAQLFHAMGRLSPQILQTCRGIWLEANHLIFQHAEPEFFLYGANPFEDFNIEEAEGTVRGLVELDFFLRKLTPLTQRLLHLTINADMEVLSRWTLGSFAICHYNWPVDLTIILRVRKISVQPPIRTPSVDSEEARQMVGHMLHFAAHMETKRFKLQI